METPALQSEHERPRQTIASNGLVALVDEASQDSKDGETSGYSIPDLPEEIWRHIHSLMQMDDAARAACLSHAFLSSWRCYSKLILSRDTFSPASGASDDLGGSIDSILRNHSGIGLKILKLNLYGEDSTFPYTDSWLQVAVTPGIEELTLKLYKKYKFPCSILSHGVRNSIRSLQLEFCVFHPTPELGPLRSLTKLRLRDVPITGDELECLLSNSLALEHLDLDECQEMTFLKIPSMLLQLSYLNVFGCCSLKVIENKAPRLSMFTLSGSVPKLSLGEASLTMKEFDLTCNYAIYYARAKLPFIMTNLETLLLTTGAEVDTPMPHTKFVNLKHKFVNLKHLGIQISGAVSPSYDYLSLISFLDVSPSLETWWLDICRKGTEHESVFGSSSDLRQLPECRHNHLKSLEIIGFSSAKSLVELTVCIVKSAVSLKEITLDTLHGFRCSGGNNSDCMDDYDFCSSISNTVLEKASRGVLAVRKYIEDKVPPTAELKVLEPVRSKKKFVRSKRFWSLACAAIPLQWIILGRPLQLPCRCRVEVVISYLKCSMFRILS